MLQVIMCTMTQLRAKELLLTTDTMRMDMEGSLVSAEGILEVGMGMGMAEAMEVVAGLEGVVMVEVEAAAAVVVAAKGTL